MVGCGASHEFLSSPAPCPSRTGHTCVALQRVSPYEIVPPWSSYGALRNPNPDMAESQDLRIKPELVAPGGLVGSLGVEWLGSSARLAWR